MEKFQTILEQLGGNKFIVMTGAKNFVYSEATEKNPNPYLQMDLPRNEAKVNKLKISIMPEDTYTLEFFNFRMVNFGVKFSNQQTFQHVYADQLQSVFKKVTGFDTHL